jgi:replicative DNA helicase
VSPHADAERAVLAAAMIEPSCAAQAVGLLVPADFADDRHRPIFAAVLQLRDAGQAVDPVTVAGELERAGRLKAAGGPEYLGALLDGMPHIRGIDSWARTLRERSRVRSLRAALVKVQGTLDDADASADEALAELQRIAVPGSLSGGILDRRDVAKATWRLIDDEVSGRVTGIGTGLPSLDRRLRFGGWRPGQLIYVGARTSRGKSALLLGMAEAAAAAGHRALFFSLEMTPEELGVRRLVAEAGIGLRAVFAWGEAERARALARLSHATTILERPLDFADPRVRTIAGIRAECARAQAQGGLALVIVDYLGLIRADARRDDRSLYERTTEASQALKSLAMDLGVAVLSAVQLNREPAAHPKGRPQRPTLAHFRDSGAIEQDCDVALLIHQADSFGAIRDGDVELLIEKQRNGATSALPLRWNGTCARFEEQVSS